MLQWLNYTFYKEEHSGPIENIEGQKVISCCEAHDTILLGTDTGNVLTLDGAGLSPSNIVVVEEGSPIRELISPPYCQELLICIQHEDQVVAHIKPNFAEPEGSDLNYYELPRDLQFISASAKLSRIVYTGDCQSFTFMVRSGAQPPPPKVVTPKVDSEITGLYITNDEYFNKYIYVTFARGKILCYHLNNHNAMEEKILDNVGCARGNHCLTDNGRLVVYRNGKVTIFSRDGKETETNLESPPKLMAWAHNCLVSASKTGTCSIKIYDLNTHCCFLTLPHGDKVLSVVSAFGCVVFIYEDGTWVCQSERDTDFKVNTLCRYQQYSVALQIAKAARMSPAWVADIHRRIGDSRFEHHSYDEAVREYVQAIGFLEPSYVITKFLEPQHAEFLCTYLEALHHQRQASRLHSILLFNCYTKLHRSDAISSMIGGALTDQKVGRAPSFDVAAAAKVLASAGYDHEALTLTRAFRLYRKTIKLLFSREKYDEGLKTLNDVPAGDCEVSIVKYGQGFLDHSNKERRFAFTDFCVRVCSTGLRVMDQEDLEDGQQMTTRPCDPELILPIFAQHQSCCFKFLTELIRQAPQRMTEKLWNNAIQSAIICDVDQLPVIMRHQNAQYSQEQALIALKEQLYELEGLLAKKQKDESIELDVKGVQHQVSKLKEALAALYERRGLYYEILVQAAYEDVLDVCRTYGAKDPSLWTDGLLILVKNKQMDLVPPMISEIMEGKVLSFIEVVGILANTSVSTYELIEKFALQTVEELQKRCANEEKELADVDAEVEQKENEIVHLKTDPFSIKPNMKCSTCTLTLETPCVHFLCGHSFHSRCLGEKAEVCSVCSREYEQKAQKKLDENQKARQVDDLLNDFAKAPDGMSLLEQVLAGQIFSPDLDEPTDGLVSFFLQRVTE